MAVDLKTLPNLPGFNYPINKERFHKAQTWGCMNGVRIEQKEGLTHDKPKFVRAVKPANTWRTGSMPDSTTRDVYGADVARKDFDELPAWDALDRHVLRFWGYFKEGVVEANLENWRQRRVTVLYYLEDDTCQVLESRQDNSGIPQGTFIRRHRFPSMSGGYVRPEDCHVGCDFRIYGKVIRLTDCDPFTREFYARQGQDQPAAIGQDQDPFSQTQYELKETRPKQERTADKLYREVTLGGGHINGDQQQFMEWDRKVCRFYCIMDDLSTPQFERRPFVVLFFLADDTVEIREQYPLNSGRDNFPIFYRRGHMPLRGLTDASPFEAPRKKTEFVHAEYFAVGDYVDLLNTKFFVYDADSFTRDYFRNELGYELGPRCDVRLPDRAVPRAQTPPYTGYGSWDDSMSSVHNLVPKAPRKDMLKLEGNDGKILRFTAKFAHPKPEDATRLFVVSFYLFDDCLSIHEPPQRNLGIVTGKFLEKGVHFNQAVGRLFKAEDLLPGRQISIFNHEFKIIEMDEYSANYFADPTKRHSRVDLQAILEKLRESMRQQFPLVRDVFRRFDADHDGVLSFAEFSKALSKYGFQLSEDEIMIIMKHFDRRQDGQVSYNEFCDTLLDEDYTKDMLKVKDPLDEATDLDYTERAVIKAADRQETEKVRIAARNVGDVLYKNTPMVKRLLNEFSRMTHKNTVSAEQIHYAFLQLGREFPLEDITRAILFVMPEADLTAISHFEFLKAMTASYQDLCASR